MDGVYIGETCLRRAARQSKSFAHTATAVLRCSLLAHFRSAVWPIKVGCTHGSSHSTHWLELLVVGRWARTRTRISPSAARTAAAAGEAADEAASAVEDGEAAAAEATADEAAAAGTGGEAKPGPAEVPARMAEAGAGRRSGDDNRGRGRSSSAHGKGQRGRR